MPKVRVLFSFQPKKQREPATGCLVVEAKSAAQAVTAIKKGLPPHTDFAVVESTLLLDRPAPPLYLPGAVTRISPSGEITSEGVE